MSLGWTGSNVGLRNGNCTFLFFIFFIITVFLHCHLYKMPRLSFSLCQVNEVFTFCLCGGSHRLFLSKSFYQVSFLSVVERLASSLAKVPMSWSKLLGTKWSLHSKSAHFETILGECFWKCFFYSAYQATPAGLLIFQVRAFMLYALNFDNIYL